MIFNNTTGLPVGYTNKILEYTFEDMIDLQKKLESGSATSVELRKFDLFQNKYDGEKRNEFIARKQLNEKNTGGLNPIKLSCDVLTDTSSTRITQKLDNIGILPVGKNPKEQIKNSKEPNLKNEDIVRQSSCRYNNLFNVKLSIATYIDIGLHAGDLVHCDFPEISNKKRPVVSKKKSGIYMIVDLCHYIDPSGNGWTRLNLVRDTIGRKPF
jgi:hypothetical protein